MIHRRFLSTSGNKITFNFDRSFNAPCLHINIGGQFLKLDCTKKNKNMNEYKFSIMENLVDSQIIGFNQLLPEIRDDNNRAMFSYDINFCSFEYCNPGELVITYLLNDKSYICLTFMAENIHLDGEAVYPKFVINQVKYSSECFYHYFINQRIIEIDIYSSMVDSSTIDELIIFKCDNGKQIILECTISMNGSIKLYFVQQNSQLAEEKKDKLIKTASFHN